MSRYFAEWFSLRDKVKNIGHDPLVVLRADLRESVRVIRAATDIAGRVENAIFCFKNNPLPVFDYKTPQDLVSEGRTEALVRYIQSLQAGFIG